MSRKKQVFQTYGRHRQRVVSVDVFGAARPHRAPDPGLFSSFSSNDSAQNDSTTRPPARASKATQRKKRSNKENEYSLSSNESNSSLCEPRATRHHSKQESPTRRRVLRDRSINQAGTAQKPAKPKTARKKPKAVPSIITNNEDSLSTISEAASCRRTTRKTATENNKSRCTRTTRQNKTAVKDVAVSSIESARNVQTSRLNFSEFENYSLLISGSPKLASDKELVSPEIESAVPSATSSHKTAFTSTPQTAREDQVRCSLYEKLHLVEHSDLSHIELPTDHTPTLQPHVSTRRGRRRASPPRRDERIMDVTNKISCLSMMSSIASIQDLSDHDRTDLSAGKDTSAGPDNPKASRLSSSSKDKSVSSIDNSTSKDSSNASNKSSMDDSSDHRSVEKCLLSEGSISSGANVEVLTVSSASSSSQPRTNSCTSSAKSKSTNASQYDASQSLFDHHSDSYHQVQTHSEHSDDLKHHSEAELSEEEDVPAEDSSSHHSSEYEEDEIEDEESLSESDIDELSEIVELSEESCEEEEVEEEEVEEEEEEDDIIVEVEEEDEPVPGFSELEQISEETEEELEACPEELLSELHAPSLLHSPSPPRPVEAPPVTLEAPSVTLDAPSVTLDSRGPSLSPSYHTCESLPYRTPEVCRLKALQDELQNSGQTLRIYLTPVKVRTSGRVVSPREKLLALCDQTDAITFRECIPPGMMKKCKKIGEGVYGEVFRSERSRESVALKIIPIEGDFPVNDEPQKTFEEMLPEIVISKELSALREREDVSTENFVQVKRVSVVRGRYPDALMKQWDVYHNNKVSENDRPDVFGDDQLFLIFEFNDCGSDLESFKLSSLPEARSVLYQVTCALAIAEESLHFEHRDLHWGNVLIKPTSAPTVSYRLHGQEFCVQTHGVLVSIIDFTLSRLSKDGCHVFTDLSVDPTLFEGQGDYQFDVYRLMKEENHNEWESHHPFTNVLWVHYLADKLITGKKYNKPSSRDHKAGLRQLRAFVREATDYNSCLHLLAECPFFTDCVIKDS